MQTDLDAYFQYLRSEQIDASSRRETDNPELIRKLPHHRQHVLTNRTG